MTYSDTVEAVQQHFDRLIADREKVDDEARGVLREAADYISEHGWTQDSYLNRETGGVCALGAIWAVKGGLVDQGAGLDTWLADSKVCDQALRRLTKSIFGAEEGCSGVPNWNDTPERTAEDVVLALKRAAE